MKLTTMTQVTVDGVMQHGVSEDDRTNGFERSGWAKGAGDDDTRALITQTYQRASAFLFGRLKAGPGDELQVHGSGALIRWLLENDLVDEMTLLVIPVVLGQGTRLFPAAGPDIALDLAGSRADSKGVMIQVYRPAGRPRYAAG